MDLYLVKLAGNKIKQYTKLDFFHALYSIMVLFFKDNMILIYVETYSYNNFFNVTILSVYCLHCKISTFWINCCVKFLR